MLVKSTSVLLLMTGRCAMQSKPVIAPLTSLTCSSLMQHEFIRPVTNVRCCHSAAASIKNGNGIDFRVEDVPKKPLVEPGMTEPKDLHHFRSVQTVIESDYIHDRLNQEAMVPEVPKPIGTSALPHPIWSDQEVSTVQITHRNPEGIVDRMAFASVKFLRSSYDFVSGFNTKERNEAMWVNRLAFLETVAGVPGMVAAMVRHLHSLRRMKRDHGWIHTLLEEAENERMHLMTVLQLKRPSWLFRMTVLFTQGVFVNGFSLAYLLSPRFCHRFVGYLEEEAVVTYSKLLKDIESGPMQHWNTTPAPPLAVRYWKLLPNSTMKDVILAIRADEAHHRVVNHTLSSMRAEDYNPYEAGK